MVDVGIDVGGTNTRVLVAGDDTAPGQVAAPTASWRHGTLLSDPDNATRLLALIPAGLVGRADVCLAVGAHGCDNRLQCDTLAAWLSRRHPGPVLVVNDSELLAPAAGLARAIAVVCGTGSIVVGRNPKGDLVKVGGHGWLLGDPGSAPGLIRQAVTDILLAHDRGAAPGPLAAALMAHYGSADPVQLGYDFTDDATVTHWGALAPLVFEAADAGDPLAARVIDTDAARLAADVVALQGLGVDGPDVVLSGGVATAQPRLADAFMRHVALVAPGLRVHLLDQEPVKGALALARSLGAGRRPAPGSNPR